MNAEKVIKIKLSFKVFAMSPLEITLLIYQWQQSFMAIKLNKNNFFKILKINIIVISSHIELSEPINACRFGAEIFP